MNNMNGYSLYTKQPNTIDRRARVYFKTFHFETNNSFKERLVRVYIPSTYNFDDPNHRFKVIYMFDGKNLFDDYTSFVGEWHIDESIEDMIANHINDGYIVVGIDAPNTDIDRSLEMTPEGISRNAKYWPKGNGYAYKLAKFVINVVKPDIDSTFHTLSDYSGVGGSSMGGLMALYMAFEYKDYFKFCLAFSPAIFLLKWNEYKNHLDKVVDGYLCKIFFYVGGQGFERIFVETTLRTYNYLLEHGYSHDQVKLIYDSEKEHNERAWREYFPIMLRRID